MTFIKENKTQCLTNFFFPPSAAVNLNDIKNTIYFEKIKFPPIIKKKNSKNRTKHIIQQNFWRKRNSQPRYQKSAAHHHVSITMNLQSKCDSETLLKAFQKKHNCDFTKIRQKRLFNFKNLSTNSLSQHHG